VNTPRDYLRVLTCGMTRASRKRTLFAMLAAYFDGAGTPQSTGRYVIAGYVAYALNWEKLVTAWDRQLKRRPAIPFFRNASMRHLEWRLSNGLSRQDAKWKTNDLARILKSPLIQFSVVCSVDEPDFKSLVIDSGIVQDKQIRKAVGKFCFRSHYSYLFHSVVARTLWKLYDLGIRDDEVNFFFDTEQKHFECANRLLEKLKPTLPIEIRDMAGTANQQEGRKVLPLQMADLLASRARDYYRDPREKKRKQLSAVAGQRDPKRNTSLIHSRKHLRRMVAALKAYPTINAVADLSRETPDELGG
jgi:hypothetical protein